MNRIRCALLLPVLLMATFSLRAQTDARPDGSIRPYLGYYQSYKHLDEDVTGLTTDEANRLLRKWMSIGSDRFVLFDDTVRHPRYEQSRDDYMSFLAHYAVKASGQRLIKLTGDTVTSLSVIGADGVIYRRIIITPSDLIVNYKGFFYFFHRKHLPLKHKP